MKCLHQGCKCTVPTHGQWGTLPSSSNSSEPLPEKRTMRRIILRPVGPDRSDRCDLSAVSDSD
jgi:hypothetical protein